VRHLAVIATVGLFAALAAQDAVATAPSPARTGATSVPASFRSHPLIPATSPQGSVEAPIRNLGWSSYNWSGYDLNGGTYSAISGCWTVPSVSSSPGDTYSAAWVGIDGGLLNGGTDDYLIQTGTEQDWYDGSAQYAAWWEILTPTSLAPATMISMTIEPGNEMCASITKGTGGMWTISLTDETTSAGFSAPESYAGPGESAEWIVERPFVDGTLSTLANYGQITFAQCAVNGASPGLTANEGGAMVDPTSGAELSTPSGPNGGANGFSVVYVLQPDLGWVGYRGLGAGPLGGQPHAVSWGANALDVFWRGTDSGLWHEWYSNGRWNGPQQLAPAGSLASDPSPVSWGAGALDVFWKGTDGNLWHVWYQNGWYGPQSLGGGPLGSAPQPVSWGVGHIDVFWKGTDGNLWHMWYGNGWYGPQSLGGGPLGSAPHPVSWGVGNIDVFWEGSGETLVHEWYGNGWYGPQSLGGAGTVASDPEPVSWGPGNIEVFWKGADGNLWQDYFANGWTGAASLGGPGGAGALTSAPVPASAGAGLLDVFWQGTDGGLWEAYYRSGWTVGARMNEGTIGSPPSAATSSGHVDVFWEGTDHNLWYDSGG
jgi:hypothetical protein